MVKITPRNQSKPANSSWFARAFPTFAGGKTTAPGTGKPGKVTPRKGGPLKPTLPTVDLLPPRLELDRLKRSTRRGFFLSGFAIVGTAILLYTGQIAVIELSSQELNAANAKVAQAEARISEFGAVQSYYAQVQAREDLLNSMTSAEVNYDALSELLLSALPSGATLRSFGAKGVTPSTDPSANPASQCGPVLDPFSTAEAEIVACVYFGGFVSSREQIAQMTIDLSRSPLIVNPNITEVAAPPGTSSSETSALEYSGTAAVTAAALRAAAAQSGEG
jgi:hypothetical protein